MKLHVVDSLKSLQVQFCIFGVHKIINILVLKIVLNSNYEYAQFLTLNPLLFSVLSSFSTLITHFKTSKIYIYTVTNESVIIIKEEKLIPICL